MTKNIDKKEDDYNVLVNAYDYSNYQHGYGLCSFPFTFQEYLNNKDECMEKYKYLDIH